MCGCWSLCVKKTLGVQIHPGYGNVLFVILTWIDGISMWFAISAWNLCQLFPRFLPNLSFCSEFSATWPGWRHWCSHVASTGTCFCRAQIIQPTVPEMGQDVWHVQSEVKWPTTFGREMERHTEIETDTDIDTYTALDRQRQWHVQNNREL